MDTSSIFLVSLLLYPSVAVEKLKHPEDSAIQLSYNSSWVKNILCQSENHIYIAMHSHLHVHKLHTFVCVIRDGDVFTSNV